MGLADATHSPASGDQSYLTATTVDPASRNVRSQVHAAYPELLRRGSVHSGRPGSTYNLYWKLKGDATVGGAWCWIYWTNDAGDEIADLYNNWNWWAAPTAWTQYPGSIAACGDNWTGVYAPIVGAVPPVGATKMYIYLGCESDWG